MTGIVRSSDGQAYNVFYRCRGYGGECNAGVLCVKLADMLQVFERANQKVLVGKER